jgi:phosphatidylserine/phosphatidylglycerophosphate/cardiolipin synthase-like enzyme/uncharacterized membrane protein YdjX (TVP38/TMEM64 family)
VTCWRTDQAHRASVIVDGAAYYAALRSSFLKAKKSITIVGWDIDSRAPLRPLETDAPDDGAPAAPETLGALLAFIAERRPDIEIRILLWNYSILYAIERELLPALSLGWQTPPQVEFCFDDMLPLGASQHQKIVVVDGLIAYCGGLDVTSRRWDKPSHAPDDPERLDPAGKPYAPFHDVQMLVDGDAAKALAELVASRWRCATGKSISEVAVAPGHDPWPTGVAVDFEDVEVGLARTMAAFGDRPEVREVEALFLRSVALARRHIYIENQYLTADKVADALCHRLREAPDLEAVIVSPDQPHGWLEEKSMGAGRIRFRRCLERAGVLDRVRLLYPYVSAGRKRSPVMVHSKIMAVDDAFLRIGSANLNNRSMGLDSECDLAVEARDADERRGVAAIRDRLLAEHLGVEPEAVAAAIEAEGSLIAAVDRLGGAQAGRGLAPIQDRDDYDDEIGRTIRPLADPERPIDSDELMGGMYGVAPARDRFRRWATFAAAGGVLVGLTLLWQFTPLADVISPEKMAPRLDAVAGEPWAPFALLAAFVVGGFVVFPVTILIALTALAFGPLQGFAYALAGVLLSAGATYHAGRKVRRRWLRSLMGARIDRVSRRLAKQGIVSVFILRLVPVAPFTFINLIAGAARIRFRDYLIGTVLGMVPGIVIMTMLGDRLRELWENPSGTAILLVGAVILLWLGLSLVLQRAVSRRRS